MKARLSALGKAAAAGRAWGSPAFLARLSERTGRITQPRPRGRPAKSLPTA